MLSEGDKKGKGKAGNEERKRADVEKRGPRAEDGARRSTFCKTEKGKVK